MLSNSPAILRLSQSHLNTITTCPRKFQNTYLEQINIPLHPEYEEKQILGSKFHLLMQQKEMGLPIDNLLQQDQELQTWMNTFYHTSPDIFPLNHHQPIFRESEHYRTWKLETLTGNYGNYLFTVAYDLLIADENQAYILDWKTYIKPEKSEKLRKNWQTRLYMYVLAETSNYLFENISMTYWFVQSPDKINYVKFQYSEKQHQQTTQELNQILNNLNTWLQDYQNNVPFPQVQEMQTCKFCPYNSQCQRQEHQNNHSGINHDISNLAKIQEISL